MRKNNEIEEMRQRQHKDDYRHDRNIEKIKDTTMQM